MHAHLPSYKATPLLVLLACCLGMAGAGAIPKNHNRLDTGSPTPSKAASETLDSAHKHTETRPEVGIARSQQRALLKNGKRIKDIPLLPAAVTDNGTVVQQRIVKRQTSESEGGAYCEIREDVVYYHPGECVVIGGQDFCQTDYMLDMANSDCL